MKIAILGFSGSGKSTMARVLGARYSCPVLHLDRIQFESNWKERDTQQSLELVHQFMENKSWVIDGNYQSFDQERRLEEADLIVFLNFPRRICFPRIYLRLWKNRNRTREDMAPGCIEKVDFEFVRWVLFDGRTKKIRQHFKQILRTYPSKTIELRTRRQVSKFLAAAQSIGKAEGRDV